MTTVKANIDHLEDLVPLFDGYRIFYRQESDKATAHQFLLNRLTNKDSVIYLAYSDNMAVGFTQLYYSFSSVSLKPIFILNDLYVHKDYRGSGIGELLINRAKALCKDLGYKGMAIQTETNNKAQNLYKRLNFKPDPDLHFFWDLE